VRGQVRVANRLAPAGAAPSAAVTHTMPAMPVAASLAILVPRAFTFALPQVTAWVRPTAGSVRES